MQALDLIEPRFRALYEKICVGNKTDPNVFFELLQLEQGVGTAPDFSLLRLGAAKAMLTLPVQVVISHSMENPNGATPTTFANPSVGPPPVSSLPGRC